MIKKTKERGSKRSQQATKGKRDWGKDNRSRAGTKGAASPLQSKPTHQKRKTTKNERIEMLDKAQVGPIVHHRRTKEGRGRKPAFVIITKLLEGDVDIALTCTAASHREIERREAQFFVPLHIYSFGGSPVSSGQQPLSQ